MKFPCFCNFPAFVKSGTWSCMCEVIKMFPVVKEWDYIDIPSKQNLPSLFSHKFNSLITLMLPLSLTSVVILCKNSKSVLHVNKIIKSNTELNNFVVTSLIKIKTLILLSSDKMLQRDFRSLLWITIRSQRYKLKKSNYL